MDFKEKRHMILNGDMKKVIFILALPIMLNNFIQTIYNITDMYFISKLGDTQMAGVQFVWPLIFLMMSFGIGMSIAGSALIAQYIGSQQKEKAQKVGAQLITLLLALSVLLGIPGFLATPYIIKWMGASGDLLLYGTSYLQILFLGLPAIFMLNAYNAIKQGQGDMVSPLILGATSVGLNIILTPLFIFVFNWGLEGAAYATVISKALFAFAGIATTFFKSQSLQIKIQDLIPDYTCLKEIISVGVPSSAGQATTAFGFTVLNMFIISFGEVTLNAFAIGNRVSSLIMMPAMGIGSSLATVVGQNLGANNTLRARQAVKSSAILSTWILVIGGLMMYPFSESIVSLFSASPEVIESGTAYLKILFLTIPFMGYFQILVGTFQGSGHTLTAMGLMMGRLWGLRIPMILLLTRVGGFGPTSIWYAMILSNMIICLVGLVIYQQGKWQVKVIKSHLKTAS